MASNSAARQIYGLTDGSPDAPLVSVIIPNFNLGAYLPYTLSSVAGAGYPNIEIIVCDDASTDPHTIELLGRLEQEFKNRSLTIVYAGYNRGLAGARNLAIQRAKGKYILTLDADDLISPDFIAKAVGALERNPDYSIVVPQTAFFRKSEMKLRDCNPSTWILLSSMGKQLPADFSKTAFLPRLSSSAELCSTN